MNCCRNDDLISFLANQSEIKYSYIGHKDDIERIERGVANNYDMIFSHLSTNNLIKFSGGAFEFHEQHSFEAIRKQFVIIGRCYIIRSVYCEIFDIDVSDVRKILCMLEPVIAGDIIFVSRNFSWCMELRMNGDFIFCVSPYHSIVNLIRLKFANSFEKKMGSKWI